MSDKLISILMPAWKVEKHRLLFIDALRGIVEQTYRNWELIIACDGGHEKTIKCVRDVVAKLKDSRIRTMKARRRHGSGVLRNMMYQYANGDYLVFHDSDDFSIPTRFEKMINEIDGYGIIASNIAVNKMYTNQDGEPSQKRKKSFTGENYNTLIENKRVKAPVCLAAAMVTRELFERMGGFDPYMYSTEPNFVIRLGYLRALTGEGPIPIINEPLYIWNRHSLSVTTQFTNNYAVKKCQSAQRKPLKRAFRSWIITEEISIGEPEDQIKKKMGIKNNLVNLTKLYPIGVKE